MHWVYTFPKLYYVLSFQWYKLHLECWIYLLLYFTLLVWLHQITNLIENSSSPMGTLNLQDTQICMFCRPYPLLAQEWCLTSELLQRRVVFLFINQLESNNNNSSNNSKLPTTRLYNCNISNNRQPPLYLPHVRPEMNKIRFSMHFTFLDGSTALTIPRYQ